MGSAVAIYKGRDFFIPAFDIKLGGQDLPATPSHDILEVKYSDNIDQFDTFEMTVNNWDADKEDFKYTGSRWGNRSDSAGNARYDLFDPGKTVEVWMGYFKPMSPELQQAQASSLRLMLVGTILSLTPSFPAAGQPTLKVSGKNVLHKLITKQDTKTYPGLKASAIARQVGKRGNLKIDNFTLEVRTDPSAEQLEPTIEYVIQKNQYDIIFLLQLAHRHGYDIFLRVDNSGRTPKQYLFFGPSTAQPPTQYLLEWGKSLIQFQPTLTTAKQVNQLTVHGWNPLKKKPIEITVGWKDLKVKGLQDPQKMNRILEGFKQREDIIVDQPFHSEQEAKAFALDKLSRLAKDLVSGKGSTLGTPDLRAGSYIQLDGLGSTFNGPYFVVSTTHSIGGSGYVTDFEARMEVKN
jgi:phage protein D